jgi:hypothetical protein
MQFETNGDYTTLEVSCEFIAKHKIPGLILEIGTRRGGSAQAIADNLEKFGDTNRTIISIDPYGQILYERDDKEPVRYDYTNSMRNETIPDLMKYINGKGFNYLFFNMGDDEFMKRFHDGVPIYSIEKTIEDKYALVYVDGPHSTDAVLRETIFLVNRMSTGGVIVYDDCQLYDHGLIDHVLKVNGFELLNSHHVNLAYFRNI